VVKLFVATVDTSSSATFLGVTVQLRAHRVGWLSNEEHVMGQSKYESQLPTVAGIVEDRPVTWTDENALALKERRVWIEANGLPLADLQVLKLD
jgi:hypothetical protein